MSNNAIGKSWSDVRNQLFTPDEIAESDLRVALIGELIKARQEKGISQKKLEELSGVKQLLLEKHLQLYRCRLLRIKVNYKIFSTNGNSLSLMEASSFFA